MCVCVGLTGGDSSLENSDFHGFLSCFFHNPVRLPHSRNVCPFQLQMRSLTVGIGQSFLFSKKIFIRESEKSFFYSIYIRTTTPFPLYVTRHFESLSALITLTLQWNMYP